jgi:hypothetical protein
MQKLTISKIKNEKILIFYDLIFNYCKYLRDFEHYKLKNLILCML